MSSTTDSVQAILARLQTAGAGYAEQKPGAREQLLSLSNALTAALELPSETIQRIGWAEVSSVDRRKNNVQKMAKSLLLTSNYLCY